MRNSSLVLYLFHIQFVCNSSLQWFSLPISVALILTVGQSCDDCKQMECYLCLVFPLNPMDYWFALLFSRAQSRPRLRSRLYWLAFCRWPIGWSASGNWGQQTSGQSHGSAAHNQHTCKHALVMSLAGEQKVLIASDTSPVALRPSVCQSVCPMSATNARLKRQSFGTRLGSKPSD